MIADNIGVVWSTHLDIFDTKFSVIKIRIFTSSAIRMSVLNSTFQSGGSLEISFTVPLIV